MARTFKTLADYLKRTGTTQRALAVRLGVSAGYTCQLVSGQRQPALHLALKIARVTGVPVTSLVPERAA
ncbi:MAG TPA: helix-turn-helix transcriptional regulator [Gemmatimonadaceae bacterium]|nr:helix-turn-helix transcriptional regulator [Gemmatimonadaceae bacterium]